MDKQEVIDYINQAIVYDSTDATWDEHLANEEETFDDLVMFFSDNPEARKFFTDPDVIKALEECGDISNWQDHLLEEIER